MSKRTERYEDIIKQSPKPSVGNNAKVTATAEEPISSDPIADSAKKRIRTAQIFLDHYFTQKYSLITLNMSQIEHTKVRI